jgi:mannan endo-1,4-beta-mannosidase
MKPISFAKPAALVAATATAAGLMTGPASAQPVMPRADTGTYAVIGQPGLADSTLGSRCANSNARFTPHDFGGGFSVAGPTGIAIGPKRRLFVVDDGGHRVLSWPNADAVATCQAADQVIGADALAGPEAITVDGVGNLYVADTLNHTVDIFNRTSAGGYPAHPTYVLGSPGESGNGTAQFQYPRGLAVDETGRLYVADDYNHRILIFDPPFASGMSAADSIGAGNDGGFSGPKAVAVSGDSLFVADYDSDRVLRFTGPFDNPATTYTSTATFSGLRQPVDLTVGPNGWLYVTAKDQNGDSEVAVYADAIAGGAKAAPDLTSDFGGHITDGEPLGIAVDASSRVFLADYRGYRVVVSYVPASTAAADHAATPAATKVLSLLRSRAGARKGRVLLGQEMSTFYAKKADWYRDFARLHKRGLRTPYIMGAELDSLRDNKNNAALNMLISHAKAGGIATIDWHPNSPFDNTYPGTPATGVELATVTSDPQGAAYQAWHQNLDGAAATLQRFADAGVPVLFRPLVEMNGVGFFWWSDDGSSGPAHAARLQAFAAMWRDMVQYLTQTKGLHNLLFVYSPNAIGCSCAVPAMSYYPGPAFVDAIGIDVYNNTLSVGRTPIDKRGRNTYEAAVATGKPFGFGEFGQGSNATFTGTGRLGRDFDARLLAKRVRDSYPRMAFASAWYSEFSNSGKIRFVYGLSDIAHVGGLIKDKLIKTLPSSAP